MYFVFRRAGSQRQSSTKCSLRRRWTLPTTSGTGWLIMFLWRWLTPADTRCLLSFGTVLSTVAEEQLVLIKKSYKSAYNRSNTTNIHRRSDEDDACLRSSENLSTDVAFNWQMCFFSCIRHEVLHLAHCAP